MDIFISTIDAIGDDELCDRLITRTLTEYKDNRITKIGNSAFNNCVELKELDIPNVTSIGNLALCEIAVESLNLPSVTDMGEMCCDKTAALKLLNAPELRTVGNYCFRESGLTTLYCPKLSGGSAHSVFCSSKLEDVCLPSLTAVSLNMFSACKCLTKADFPVSASIGNAAFSGCIVLKTLVLRYGIVCSLGGSSSSGNPFANTPIEAGTGYVYVPKALIENYKTATNWSSYESIQFRALEDYTVDGTITGALDESKI